MTLPKVSVVFLQVVIVLHFVLTVWANQCPWLPTSYQFCNFLVLALGVGAVVAQSDHAISELFLFGMAFALLHDIIIVAVTYDGDNDTRFVCKEKDHFRFSFGMAILNLLLKPVSCVLILLNYLTRGDGGLRQKVAQYRANRGTGNTEPPNESLPPQETLPY